MSDDESVRKTAAEEISEIQAHLAEPEDARSPPDWRAFLNWAHLGTTITLSMFLWNNYQVGVRDQRDNAERMAKLEAAQIEFRAAQSVQDNATRQLVEGLTRVLDVHRADLRQLQSDFVQHLQNDMRKFERAGVR